MPQDFGPLAGLVGTVGSIIAAVGAIALTWRGRSRWEPSETDVASGPQRVGGLVNAVLIAVLWVLTRPAGSPPALPALAVALAIVTVAALLAYGFVTATQTYEDAKRRRKVIGGFQLTREAKREIRKQKLTVQQYFSGVAYDPDEVWPRSSRALAKLAFVLLYLLLVVSGTVAVAAAAILIEKQAGPPPTATPTPTPTPTPSPTPNVAGRTLRWVDGPVSGVVLDGGVLEPGKSVWLQELFPASPPTAFQVVETADLRMPQDVRDALALLELPRFAPTINGFQAVSDSAWKLPGPFEGIGYRTFSFTDENPDGTLVQSGTIASGRANVASTGGAGCLSADANGTYTGAVGEASCIEFTATAARDPTFDVRVLMPWAENNEDLVSAVRRYLEALEADLARQAPTARFSADAALRVFLRDNAGYLPRRPLQGWELRIEPSVVEVGAGEHVPVRLGIAAGSGGSALIAIVLVDRSDGSTVMSPLLPITIVGNAPPTVSIIEPAKDVLGPARLSYTGFDQGKWYTEVKVAATASDPEDGTLTGASATWTTDRTELQRMDVGSGDSLLVRLYAWSCEGGAIHTITVTVRDSQGTVATATRVIEIGQLC